MLKTLVGQKGFEPPTPGPERRVITGNSTGPVPTYRADLHDTITGDLLDSFKERVADNPGRVEGSFSTPFCAIHFT